MATFRMVVHVWAGVLVTASAFLFGSVVVASNSSYNDFRGKIVAINEDASTTRLSNDRVMLQHKNLDLLVEAVDEDGRLIDDDDRYHVVAVVDEDGYYEKTVSALYKSSEDARRISTTLGERTDSVTLYLLCDNCSTGYKFGHVWSYNKWNIVDSVYLRVELDDDFSNKRIWRTSYRKWSNFEDYKDFFNNDSRYSSFAIAQYNGSSKGNYSSSNKKITHKDKDYDYYSKGYDQYSRKDYRSLGNIDYDAYNKKDSYNSRNTSYSNGGKCASSRCAPTAGQPTVPKTTTRIPPTTACRSTTVGCGNPNYVTPTYQKPTSTKTYYYNNPTYSNPPTNYYTPPSNYTPPTTTTKVYQCSSNGCKWIYTQG